MVILSLAAGEGWNVMKGKGMNVILTKKEKSYEVQVFLSHTFPMG